MENTQILYPALPLIFLTMLLLPRIAMLRIAAVRRGDVDPDFYKLYRGEGEPESIALLARHYQNLLELPVLFYVALVVAFAAGEATTLLVGLAWLYTALRIVHSFVHLSSNVVPRRLGVFGLSALTLTALWIVLTVGLLT